MSYLLSSFLNIFRFITTAMLMENKTPSTALMEPFSMSIWAPVITQVLFTAKEVRVMPDPSRPPMDPTMPTLLPTMSPIMKLTNLTTIKAPLLLLNTNPVTIQASGADSVFLKGSPVNSEK